jgi:hypothetical protein
MKDTGTLIVVLTHQFAGFKTGCQAGTQWVDCYLKNLQSTAYEMCLLFIRVSGF